MSRSLKLARDSFLFVLYESQIVLTVAARSSLAAGDVSIIFSMSFFTKFGSSKSAALPAPLPLSVGGGMTKFSKSSLDPNDPPIAGAAAAAACTEVDDDGGGGGGGALVGVGTCSGLCISTDCCPPICGGC